jgi:S1-C subfamily serine protease
MKKVIKSKKIVKSFRRDLIECMIIGIILGAITIFGFIAGQDYATFQSVQIENNIINNQSIKEISKQLEQLNNKIEQVPVKIKLDKLVIESKLKRINVFITNETLQATGSGVTIKWKNNFYVLSAGHMVADLTDKIFLSENGETICELEIVKHDYNEELTKDSNDLLLLRPKDPNIIPKIYVEISDIEPETSNELYIVGNPMGVEDVVSDARVIMYEGNFMYMIATSSYFGNSGGGIYTKEGKLVGIMSHLIPIQPSPTVPAWMIHGCVRLSVILEFLRGVS